jgi:allantoin racemase
MAIKIRDVSPNVSPTLREGKLDHRQRVAGPGIEVDVISLRRGPISMETTYEAMLAAPGLLEEISRAEEEGFDGVFIDCFGDPVLRPGRELADIPMMAAGMAAMLFAMALGDKFSIVTVRNALPSVQENVRAYCFQERVASIRWVEFSSFELYRYASEVEDKICHESRKAIEEDGADVIVLGCTAMSHAARSLSKRLGVPVIDPAGAGLKMLVDVVEMGLCHSKRAYPSPPDRSAQLRESGLESPEELARVE